LEGIYCLTLDFFLGINTVPTVACIAFPVIVAEATLTKQTDLQLCDSEKIDTPQRGLFRKLELAHHPYEEVHRVAGVKLGFWKLKVTAGTRIKRKLSLSANPVWASLPSRSPLSAKRTSIRKISMAYKFFLGFHSFRSCVFGFRSKGGASFKR
jgi:hypothetical protein